MTQPDKWSSAASPVEANLNPPYTTNIYYNILELPENWDLLANGNVFLSKKYLEVLEEASPSNMVCQYIGIFNGRELVGIAISQFLDLNQIDCYGNKRKVRQVSLKNFLFKNFASNILVIGNNMLSGEHAFESSSTANNAKVLNALNAAALELKSRLEKKGVSIHLTIFKDFHSPAMTSFSIPTFAKDLRFSVQPNMVLHINKKWQSEEEYAKAFNKKYRSQYKRARLKCIGVEKRELSLEEIIVKEDELHELYLHVASNAPFNTFYLPKNHFSTFKKKLGKDFLLFGYFMSEKLIGFKTMINNGDALDSYFLGYSEAIQKEKMLYLNMLYDMTGHAIQHGFSKMVFGRTALEIKSSIGAVPEPMTGLMRHNCKPLNRLLPFFFNYLEPKTEWKKRNPFQPFPQ